MTPRRTALSSLRSTRWRWETGIFFGLLWLLLGFAPNRFFRDPGTFWHTRIGQKILETGQLPEKDEFTYSMAGKPWVSQYWLCQIGMAGLYTVGGWDSLLVVTATLLSGLFAWCAGRLIETGSAGIVAAFLTALAVAANTPQFHVRPVVLTTILMAVLFSILADVESGRRSLRQLWWLIPLFIFWTNVHGGVIGGLGSFSLVAIGWISLGLLRLESPVRTVAQGIEITALAIACLSTVLLNPYGRHLPCLWLEILRFPTANFIVEHAPLWQDPLTAVLPITLALLYVAILLSTPWKSIRFTWLLPAPWFMLAWSHARHASLFAIVTIVILADLLPHSRASRLLAWRGFFHPDQCSPTRSRDGWWRLGWMAGIIGCAMLLQVNGVAAPLLGNGCAQLDPVYWPVELLPQLKVVENSVSNQTRIFNDGLYGGFLIFHTPKLAVLVDDRCELFGEEFIRKYCELFAPGAVGFQGWDDHYNFSHALVQRGSPIATLLRDSPEWFLVAQTSTAALLEKKRHDIFQEPEASRNVNSSP